MIMIDAVAFYSRTVQLPTRLREMGTTPSDLGTLAKGQHTC